MRTIAIEFDSWTTGLIVTSATDEQIQAVMTKFEDREDFIDDSYEDQDFFNFLSEQGIEFTQVGEANTTLFFDRNKQI